MHKVTRRIILLLILIVSLAGSTGAQTYLVGDVDGNYKVDANDLKILADHWLDPGCLAPACKADLDGMPGVSMSDVALLAGDWGRDHSRITLVINEFMTENDRFIQDPNGDYHDWIEIYNYGDETIDIGGMYLTDDVNDANQWYRIPDNCPEKTTIGPSGYLLIWADGELSEDGLHVDFALDAGGEEDIGLIDTDGSTLIDSIIDFPALGGDNSYGRFPNGSGSWSVFLHDTNTPPTPGEFNGSGSGINVVINEIMYHPYHSTTGTIEPEDIRAEYIELFNRGTELVNLSGWRITDGVAFSFPNDVTIDVGEYLVVAADVNTFKANYPGVTNVVGGWYGRLSNSGEEIELIDDMRVNVDHVRYADEGDWAVRKLGPIDYFHRGWVWYDEHDGGGKSLELVNPALPNQYGQNWAASLNDGGTPGVVNSVADNDIAPMILDARHRPVIPGFTDPVAVKAYIIDELTTGITVTLNYHVDSAPPGFTALTMYDDATHGDSDANDGVYTAQIPAYPDGMIIEFYIEASDAGANLRTWPAPSDVDGTPQQVTNLLYQVDGSFDPNAKWVPGSQPIYYLIMKETERAELADIGDSDLDGKSIFASEAMSNAQMNATFISVDGVDAKTRYTVGVRNRGNRNRSSPPNNYRVNFRHDDSWKGVTALNLNTKYTHLQFMGSVLYQMAGAAAAKATIVQVRVNGQNLATTDYGRTYNSYVALENYDSDWPENHVPDDDAGNLYRCTYFDNDVDPRTYADLDYKPNMTEYRKNYPKQTNVAQDDYSDLLNLIDKLNNPAIPDAEFMAEVSQVVNLEQWTRYLAADALAGNREGGLNDGRGDDYAMYRGVEDPRFWLLPHDLDTMLGQGDHDYRPEWDIFNYVIRNGGVDGLERLMSQPEFIKLYYNQYEELIHTVFALENVYPLVDRLLADWVSSSEINGSNGIKEYLAERIDSILYGGYPSSSDDPQIPQQFSINSSLPMFNGYHQTNEDVAVLDGTANAIKTSSVLVNGWPAEWSALDGEWSFGESTGIPVEDVTLVPIGATASYHVPTIVDAALGEDWTAVEFDDSVWDTGQTGLAFGFGRLPSVAYNDCVYRSAEQYIGDNVTTYGIGDRYTGPTSGPLLDQATGDNIGVMVTLTQNGGVTWQAEPGSGGSDCAAGTDAYNTFGGITDMTGVIYYGSSGWWVDLTFTGLEPTTEYAFATSAARCNYTNRLTIYTITGADTYTNASTSGVDVLAENKVRFNTGDNYSEGYVASWTGITASDGSFKVRAEADPTSTDGYKAYSFDVFKLDGAFSGTDVQGDMLGVNASLWTRIEFDVVEDPTLFNTLKLRMKYEDGFVAYLNGQEVASRNAPSSVEWNSTADSNRPVGDALAFEEINLMAFVHLLQPGLNVLAIHGLNDNKDNGDFLILPELVAGSTLDPVNGVALNPGINRIFVQTFDEPGGTGSEMESGFVDVWYNTGLTDDYPKETTGWSTNLIVRDSYLPGVPVLVRVEVVGEDSSIKRELWDATATLSVSDNPTINLSTNQVTLYNGLGSALVTFTGSGNFTLTVDVDGLQATAGLTDWSGQTINTASGILGSSQTWSGIYHVTGGDFTIPAGVILTLNPGTLVLIDGVSSGTNGTDIDVAGSIQSLGTAASPVTFTAYTAGQNWGEVHHDNAEPSTFLYTNITQGGHSPAVGHSNTGPTIRASNSTLVFDYASLTDNAGKLMHVTSGSELTFRHCLFARSVMGPEMSGTALLFEDGWITDMHAGDDADGIYVGPQQSGQTCIMSRGVSANMVDDGIDLNGADITIEDFIVRDCNDKGISVYNGETYIDHCLVVETNRNPEDPTVSGMAAKAHEGATTIVNIDHTTLVTTKTAGVTDYGIQSHNKYGVSTGTIIWNVTNSIIDATDPVNTQAPYLDSDVHINYSNVFGEPWPGVGNINLNPQFVNPVNSDYQLQVSSPCIDAGDPVADPDPDLTVTDQGYFWFDQDAPNLPEASLAENTVWTPEQGPYRITGELTVPVGITLTVMPGTTVFFDPGTRIIIEGRLLAEGTEYELIRFTRTPGTGTEWNGLQFVNTMSDNRITYAVIEYGRTMDGMIGLNQSNLLLDHVTLDHTDRRRISTLDSSLIVRNSTFTNIFEFGQAPTGDNICEHIWGTAPATGHFIIENNVFGTITGHNDAVDVDGNIRPAPVIRILDNLFLGGGDDALDLEGDAHVEGNVFMHYRKDEYNTGSGNSNVMSAGGGYDYVVVRNVFYDVDHVAQVKSSSFMTFVNNTVMDVNVSALYFLRPTSATDYGRGAYVDGSIFRNIALLFDRFTASTELTANRCIIPSEWHSYGVGNIDADPVFVDPKTDFHLKSMSPAIEAGPLGLDMGAHVPAGAAVCGEPYEVTHRTDATLTVGGPGITDYKYCVNDSNGPWSGEFSVDTPIVLNGLSDGQSYTVYVIGRNSAGAWQSENNPTASRTWTVDTSHWRLVINEVLARNVDAVGHNGTNPDLIELYYDGPVPLDLGDMSISDNPENPRKFVFPVGTVIEPNDYLVLYADNNPVTPGIHLGFGLDGESEDIYLYDGLFFGGGLLDSVEFGLQLPDLSIGRIGCDGRWTLTQPTFGRANTREPLGDPAMLKINEWFTNSDMLTENNFIELYNPHAFPVDLDGMFLTDNPVTEPNKHQLAPLSFVPGVGMAVLIADGDPRDGLNHLNFRLSADQEIIGLFDAGLNEIDKVIYGPQTSDVSQGRSPDGSDTYAFCDPPTPGVSNIDTVLINEVLAHSPPGDTDWIELHNTTGTLIDLGGWFLSDNSGNRMKYEIAAGTTIESNNYIVFREDVNFGNPNDPGCHIPFALSENGETLCLSSGLNGVLTGYYKEQQFGASRTGVSFGRYLTSTGRYDFVAMDSNTLEQPNANPKVGPVVINEIMYNPPSGNQDEEYIELHNITGALVTLYRHDKSTPWKFTDGIDYTFSAGSFVTIKAYGYLIMAKDLTAFTLRYGGMPYGVQVIGGYGGRLANDGERLRISMPGDVNSDGERQYICIDCVRYYDKYPWPTGPDGYGKSLSRKVSTDYGNDVINWQAAAPSPGVANP